MNSYLICQITITAFFTLVVLFLLISALDSLLEKYARRMQAKHIHTHYMKQQLQMEHDSFMAAETMMEEANKCSRKCTFISVHKRKN